MRTWAISPTCYKTKPWRTLWTCSGDGSWKPTDQKHKLRPCSLHCMHDCGRLPELLLLPFDFRLHIFENIDILGGLVNGRQHRNNTFVFPLHVDNIINMFKAHSTTFRVVLKRFHILVDQEIQVFCLYSANEWSVGLHQRLRKSMRCMVIINKELIALVKVWLHKPHDKCHEW